MNFFNQHSFTITAAFGTLVLAIILFRDGISRNDLITISALVVGLILAFLLFRPDPSIYEDLATIEEKIGAGTPVLLEFQSDY
jgi:hypothetical protein